MTRNNNGVTLKDVYDVVQRLEDKMDSRLKDVEKRIDSLEQFQSKFAGISLVLSSIIGIVGSWFWNKIVKS